MARTMSPKAAAKMRNRVLEILDERRRAGLTFNTPKGKSVTRLGPAPGDAWRNRIVAIQKEAAARASATSAVARWLGVQNLARTAPPPPPTAKEVYHQQPPVEIVDRSEPRDVTPVEPVVSSRAADQVVEVSPVERGGQVIDDFNGTPYGFNEAEEDFGDLESDLGLAD